MRFVILLAVGLALGACQGMAPAIQGGISTFGYALDYLDAQVRKGQTEDSDVVADPS